MSSNVPVPTVTRITVSLSKKTVVALDAVAEETEDTKTEIVNKAVQLWREVVAAQAKGGGVFIQKDEESDPVRTVYW